MTKDVTRIGIAAAAISLALIAGTSQQASAETIKLTTQEWKPYQSVTNGQLDGLAVKAVKCVLDKMGHQPELIVLPWNRAQKEVADGNASGFFAASKSADRDSFAEMSQPFIPQVWKWYSLAGKTVDFSNKATKVGVLAGSSMEKWLEENGFAATQKIQSTDALVKMLQSGRFEAVLANEIVFKEAVAGAGATEAGFTATQHSERPLGVYFGKSFLASHPGFLDGFNAQIKACR